MLGTPAHCRRMPANQMIGSKPFWSWKWCSGGGTQKVSSTQLPFIFPTPLMSCYYVNII